MSTAIQTVTPKEIQQWTSPTHIKERIKAIQKLMKDVLKPGTKENDWSGDYGIVPGTKKPSLWKSGSEQILAMFQISVEPIVEDLSSDDCYRYRVTTRLTNAQTGDFLGAGIGEASTDETKYKWRRTYSKPEFEAADPSRRRVKYGQYKDAGKWVDTEEMQVRQEPADLANTVLKMAKKRSQIDATLTVTGASSMFEQDLEDLPEETRAEMLGQRKKAHEPTGDVMCNECRAINGHLPNCSFRKQPVTSAPAPAQTIQAAAPAATPPDTAKGLETMLLQVQNVEVREKSTKDKQGKAVKQMYRSMPVITVDGLEWTLYCWDTKLFQTLDTVKPKTNCVFVVQSHASAKGEYYSLESIVEAGPPIIPAEQPTSTQDPW